MKRQREDEEEVDEKSGPHSSRCRVEENKEALMHISLPSDIWRLIGLKLDALSRTRFRAVCKSWMSLIPQPPWLMLAQSEEGLESGSDSEAIAAAYEEDSSDDSDEEEQESSSNDAEEEEEEDENEEPINQNQQHHLPAPPEEAVLAPPPPPRGFVSLGDRQIYHIDFPQLHRAQCVGSTGNWLITAHKDNGRTIRLLNRFSKQQLYLPPQSAFEEELFETPDENLRYLFLWKVILSSSPADGRECIAIANNGDRHVAAIARLGDDKWTTVRGVTGYVEDIIFYKAHFYVIIGSGALFVCDTGDHLTPPKASRLSEGFRCGMGMHCVYDNVNEGLRAISESIYLVDWLGELLMVIRFIDALVGVVYKTSKFEVYKFDFIERKWNILKSLGEHSLFLGFNSSVSLRASNYFGCMKKNCIYFTDDFIPGYREAHIPGGHDMGIFNLEDNTITPHFSGVSTCFYSPPVWIVST